MSTINPRNFKNLEKIKKSVESIKSEVDTEDVTHLYKNKASRISIELSFKTKNKSKLA
ncbi:hypothetical protein [Zobellia sp. 1_MG-2023]|uniref:hypothetical protein n=1 Tax=Zobellia sp. 1_MG-2023 TaxID=3062626 RepID=UPI0026E45FBD|nr:hypothetical protein [Zobellia sp. 1_MG-2023]MDO6817813.1 hypothetical protein [Zobellia sp. 1_MG-2023]